MPNEFLRSRIAYVYQTIEGKETEHGAVRWFADLLGINYATLGRYLRGDRPMPGPPSLVLGLLEVDCARVDLGEIKRTDVLAKIGVAVLNRATINREEKDGST